jgi:hypothetical protein
MTLLYDTFSMNNLPSDQTTLAKQAQSALLFFKNSMVNLAGWSVVYSSNGTTASAADNCTALANFIPNTSGSARTHITFESPVGCVAGLDGSWTGTQSKQWLTLDFMSNSSANYYYFALCLHRTLPTGGSTTARQTSTYESVLFSSSYSQFLLTTLYNNKFHFQACKNGVVVGGVTKGKGAFIFQISSALYGGLNTFTGIPLINPKTIKQISGKDYPFTAFLIHKYIDYFAGLDPRSFLTGGVGYHHTGTANGSYLVPEFLMDYAGGTPMVHGYGVTDLNDVSGNTPTSKVTMYNKASGLIMTLGDLADIGLTGASLTNLKSGETPVEHGYWKMGGYGGIFVPTNVPLEHS